MPGIKKQYRISKEQRQQLIGEIKTNMTEINRRFREIQTEERQGGVSSDFIKSQKVSFSQITKSKNKYKFGTGNLQKMSVKNLKALQRLQKNFLKSKYSTKEGRTEIFEKQYATFSDIHDVSKESYKKLVSVLGSKNFRNLGEFRPPSEAIIEYLKDEGFDKEKDVISALTKFDTLPPDARNYIGNNIARSKRMLAYFVNNPSEEGREAYEKCFGIFEQSDTGE